MESNSDEQDTHDNEIESDELVEETFKMHCNVHRNGSTGDDSTGVEFELAPYSMLSDFTPSGNSIDSESEYWDILGEILDVETKEEIVDHFRERTDLRRRGTVAYILVDAESGVFCFEHLHEQ